MFGVSYLIEGREVCIWFALNTFILRWEGCSMHLYFGGMLWILHSVLMCCKTMRTKISTLPRHTNAMSLHTRFSGYSSSLGFWQESYFISSSSLVHLGRVFPHHYYHHQTHNGYFSLFVFVFVFWFFSFAREVIQLSKQNCYQKQKF